MKKPFYSFLIVVAVVLGALGTAHTASAASCTAQNLGVPAYGKRGTHIMLLQQCLIGAGYKLPSGATGYYGNETKAAIAKFYASVLKITDWDGKSIGPKGRAELARVSGGVTIPVISTGTSGTRQFVQVQSEADLAKRLESARGTGNMWGRGASFGLSGAVMAPTISAGPLGASNDSAGSAVKESSSIAPGRVSGTNVQVAGIDEPDIVKTDGKNIYVANEQYYMYGDVMPMVETTVALRAPCLLGTDCGIVPPQKQSGVTTFSAFPPPTLAVANKAIPEYGEMLLAKDKNILLVLGYDRITAYDVSNSASPVKKWTNEFKNNTQKVDARMKDGTLYLVTRTYLNNTRPCPIVPMMRGGVSIEIPCGRIWMPTSVEPADSTYTVYAIDPVTGKETNTLTVLGDNSTATFYMSENHLYLASRVASAADTVMLGFFTDEVTTLFSASTAARIKEIVGYNISYYSKLSEITSAMEKEMASFTNDERLKFENELENKMKTYLEKRSRDMDQTQITKISLATLSIAATGNIPGHLLNQFSMDEYNGNLRVAVTIGETWGWGGGKTANDVYVLDGNLKTIGAVYNLGLTERIYAARFIGDRGYLVTFRQTDPFYVIDLSVPTAPVMKGELKIPGYSAYLEPLSTHEVLGVGRESGGVKLSLFDVTDPAAPTEKAKYSLKDGWTEVEGNHHAFLRDDKHKVFFIPGGNGGYVFSYDAGALALKYAVSGYSVKRAVYIDDYLYVVGTNKVTVLDETTWKEVKALEY